MTAANLESEKDMQHIVEALARDVAEHLRPMVAEMVRQELANADGENAMEGIAQHVDLKALARHVDAGAIAGDVDLMELATKLDMDKLTRHVDVGQLVRDWLADQSFQVRPY